MASQQSRLLRELRTHLAGFWYDSAARHVNLRYFEPHEEEDGRMLAGFVAQAGLLEEALHDVWSAHESGDAAVGESAQVHAEVRLTRDLAADGRMEAETAQTAAAAAEKAAAAAIAGLPSGE
jgi:hypothetical protein